MSRPPVHAPADSIAGPELPVARIAQAGMNEPHFIQPFIDRADVNRHIRHRSLSDARSPPVRRSRRAASIAGTPAALTISQARTAEPPVASMGSTSKASVTRGETGNLL